MMNQASIFRKIGIILNELQEQYEFLAKNPEQLNELELELFLANASFLSDHAEIVRKLNDNNAPKQLPPHFQVSENEQEQIPARPPVREPVIETEDEVRPKDYSFFDKPDDLVEYVNEENPVSAEPKDETVKDNQSVNTFEFILNEKPEFDKFDYEEKPVDQIFDRPLSKEEELIVANKQRALEQEFLNNRERESGESTGAEPFIIPAKSELAADKLPEQAAERPEELKMDKVQDQIIQPVKPEPVEHKETPLQFNRTPEIESANTSRPTLNDLLAGKNNAQGSIKEENSRPVITDLKSAITLNEKLLYIKDLFNGYNLAYSEAIDLINKMPDLKTADAFLKNNYAEKNNWQAKQTTVGQFYDLLSQRFPNG